MHDNDCHQTRIAHSSVAAIDRCTCGSVQLHMAALTIRLTPKALAELAETLRDAVDVLELQRETAFSFGSPRG